MVEAAREILFLLRREIKLYESIEILMDLSSLSLEELLDYSFKASTLIETQSAYKEIEKRFPYLPIKIKPELFESWLILHTKSDLKNVLNVK